MDGPYLFTDLTQPLPTHPLIIIYLYYNINTAAVGEYREYKETIMLELTLETNKFNFNLKLDNNFILGCLEILWIMTARLNCII